MPRCPACGERLHVRGLEHEKRLGIEMTPFQARLFDLVRRRGEAGIATLDLLYSLYGERPRSRRTIHTHISRINDLLVSTDWRIRGERGQRGLSVYRLVKEAA